MQTLWMEIRIRPRCSACELEDDPLERNLTYKNPRAKIRMRPIFCRMGMIMDQTTGMGMRKIKKSVAMCRPMAAHMYEMGLQSPWMLESQ